VSLQTSGTNHTYTDMHAEYTVAQQLNQET